MYDDRYKGCPDCGEMEDKDCRCTGEDYEYVVRDAEGRVVEIVTKDGQHIVTADLTPTGGRHVLYDARAMGAAREAKEILVSVEPWISSSVRPRARRAVRSASEIR